MSKLTPADNAYHMQYDTPDIRAGAIQYVKCANCGAEPGTACSVLFYQPWKGKPLDGHAHAARRIEYHDWRDIFGEPTPTLPAPPRPAAHYFVEKLTPCWNPRQHCAECSQCACGAPLSEHVAPPPVKKSSADVDDLLG